MKLKGFTFLTFGLVACSMLVGCKKITAKILNYEEAKTWIKTNYGVGTDGGTVIKPKSISSNWYLDGKVTASTYSQKAGAVDSLESHLTNLLNSYSYVDDATIRNTILPDEERNPDNGLFCFKTTNLLQGTVPSDFYYVLDEKHMNDTLNYFFKGANKYGTTFKAYSDKTLEVSGNFYYSNSVSNGINIMEIPYCTVSFNSNGTIKQLNINFIGEAECNYFWISTITTKYSGTIYFNLFKDSKLNISFNY